MEEYWDCQPRAQSPTPTPSTSTSMNASASILSDYNWYQQTLLAVEHNKGWAAELQCYLKDMPADVTKETDIVEWWQLCRIFSQIQASSKKWKGSCSTVPNTCSDCPWHPPMSSVICPLWATVFISQTSGWQSTHMTQINKIWRTPVGEVCVVQWHSWSCCMELCRGWGGWTRWLWGVSCGRCVGRQVQQRSRWVCYRMIGWSADVYTSI